MSMSMRYKGKDFEFEVLQSLVVVKQNEYCPCCSDYIKYGLSIELRFWQGKNYQSYKITDISETRELFIIDKLLMFTNDVVNYRIGYKDVVSSLYKYFGDIEETTYDYE